MKIARIVPQKYRKDYVSIHFEDPSQEPLRLHAEVAAAKRLKAGMDVGHEALAEAAEASSLKEAMGYAYRLLSYRSLSARQMEDRLKRKGFPPLAVARALESLRGGRLIDDALLARDLAENRIRNRRLGAERVRRDLLKRGIDPDTAERVLGEAAADVRAPVPDEAERAYAWVLKRARQIRACDPRLFQRRLSDYLARRGFGPDTIEEALRRYRTEAGKIDKIRDIPE